MLESIADFKKCSSFLRKLVKARGIIKICCPPKVKLVSRSLFAKFSSLPFKFRKSLKPTKLETANGE